MTKDAATLATPAGTSREPATRIDPATLPRPVREMIDALQTAISSGNVEDLRTALEWNELPPSVSDDKIDDPIAHWRRISADGEGRQILAILADILASGPAKLLIGRDVENAGVYVWPHLAEIPFSSLTPQQLVELYRIMPPDRIAALRDGKPWTWYRLVIGADGTWHSFMEHP
ncbi:MAG: hypothetical protein KDJ37_03515 [Hyphomicrobiaceae bacterium]|nr:hypothetical protein [Hyphomicrobiaceae bacterium]